VAADKEQTVAKDAVSRAAISWWRSHRPTDVSEVKHLANPEMNMLTPAQRRLAKAVARLVQKQIYLGA